MTWTTWTCWGGESQEDLIELRFAGPAVSLSNAVTITGAKCFALAALGVDVYNISAGLGYHNDRITAFGFGIYLTDTPTVPIPLLRDDTGGTDVLTIDTDRKLNLYNSTPALVAGPSAAIPLNTAVHGVLFIDPLTVGTSNVWAVLILAGNEEWALDIGAPGWTVGTFSWGDPNGTDADITFYLDDLVTRSSQDTAEAPHLAAYPKLRVDTAFPNANTGQNDWQNTGGSSGDDDGDFGEWNSKGGHDGTDYNWEDVANLDAQYSEFEDAAELGWGANAVPYDPILWAIERVTAGSKFDGRWVWILSAVVETTAFDETGPGGAWGLGGATMAPRPGGGSWARADLANLIAGPQTDNTTHDKTWEVSLLVMEWVYEDDSTDRLPTATGPPVAGFAHSHGYIF